MKSSKLRNRIALIAAQIIFERQDPEYYRARIQAARLVSNEPIPRHQWPTTEEIRAEVRALVAAHEAEETNVDTKDRMLPDAVQPTNRFRFYLELLGPLEKVKQPRHSHPEGDVLYHSLQVFCLAREEIPYDEEFLLAALLHDVGKGIDLQDHVVAGLDALGDLITPRTGWFIEHHYDAHKLREGILGARARRRLQEHEDYDELLLLADCDRQGRVPGRQVPEMEEALDYIRGLEAEFGI